jgi:biopolymer transport protein ExbD
MVFPPTSAHSPPEINVTPMIDVLLVLIIVGMVVLAGDHLTMRVQVPPPALPHAGPVESAIVLQLPDGGGFAINNQMIPGAELETKLHMIFDNRTARVLFIDAGKNRSYLAVIRAIDRARGAGVQLIGFIPAH